jgi:tetraacyldisaccharide 4'-kinase
MGSTWRQALQSALLRAWLKRGLLATLLFPMSLCFGALAGARRQLYALGLLKIRRVDALVIVVGNVVAGGAGKTPTVMALVQHLQVLGYVVGVISRGFGRSSTACMEVMPDASPQNTGDEPLLIRRTTEVPVFVGRTRIEAATALLERYPLTQIILCDDGLQHYSLFRDLEICVFDDRGCGNGWLLPAGALREAWPRNPLAQAGQGDDRLLVLHTGEHAAFSGFTAQRSLASFAKRSDGTTIALSALGKPGTGPLLAVAGIARPESFFSMLRANQVPLAKTLALPDHYDFDSFLRNIYEGYSIICTEKDAAKLWSTTPEAWAVPLVFAPQPAFLDAVTARVTFLMSTKLSSTHGHKTT